MTTDTGKGRAPRTGPLSGRKAEANRNDATILEAARTVFINDPAAPIAAVAKEAGVGISALYRRYAGKEELLQTLCAEGLARYIAVAEEALADEDDPGRAFRSFVTGVIDADVHSLTVSLAGTFTPTEELWRLSTTAVELAERLLTRAKEAGAVRADLDLQDISMLLEQLTAVRIGDAERTRTLRHRYLAMHFAALRPQAVDGDLPGPPPSAEEVGARWIPR